jgi:hypothetical protein
LKFGRGENVEPETAWERRIMAESLVFERYGLPVDLAFERPAHDFQAHAAIVQGRNKAEEEESKKADREAQNARNSAS